MSPGRTQQSQSDDLVTPQVLPIYYLVELPLKGDSKLADGRIEQIYQKGRQSSLGLTEKFPRYLHTYGGEEAGTESSLTSRSMKLMIMRIMFLNQP